MGSSPILFDNDYLNLQDEYDDRDQELMRKLFLNGLGLDYVTDMREFYEEQPMNFLIAEDDLMSQKILEEFIKKKNLNINCFFAQTATEALNILEKKDISLVIADYYLKGFYTGVDLWLYATKRFPDVEFIITSQMKLTEYLDIVSGVAHPPQFLAKPLDYGSWKDVLGRTFVGGVA